MLSLQWLAGGDAGPNQVLLTNQLRTSCYLIYSLIKYWCFWDITYLLFTYC